MNTKILKKNLIKVWKGEKPLIDVYHYLLGNYRYFLYYHPTFKPLIRWHIMYQIKYRIRVMNRECYNNGECIKCSCATTALQMANKRCDGNCYPRMLNKKDFKAFYNKGVIVEDSSRIWLWKKDKYILFKETPHGYAPLLEEVIG